MDLPIIPQVRAPQEQPPPPIHEAQVPAPDAEQVERADQAFSSQDTKWVAGAMGMYAGTMLLRDLAREHLRRAEEEEEKHGDEETDPLPKSPR